MPRYNGQTLAIKIRSPKPRRGVGGREARHAGACPEVRAQQKTSALNL